MSEVYYLSDIGAESIELVQKYMEKFFPDAKMEMIASKGILNTCKRKIPADDCVFVVIDKELSAEIDAKNLSAVFDINKVHRYNGYSDLLDILIQNFGVDLSDKDASSVVPPDKLGGNQTLESFFDNYGKTEEDTNVSQKEIKDETIVSEVESNIKEQNNKNTEIIEESVEEIKTDTDNEIKEEETDVLEENVETSVQEIKNEESTETFVEDIEAETVESSDKDNEIVEEVETEESVKETNGEVEDNTDSKEEVITLTEQEGNTVENKDTSSDLDVDFGSTLNTEDDNVKVVNEDLETLKDKLIQAQLTISSLSSQLAELEDSNDEVLMTRIEVLTSQLESKENEIKSLRQISATTTENVDAMELTDLREELIKVKESKATLEYDKKKVEGELSLSEEKIKELQSSSITLEERIKALNRQITSNESKIERLQSEIKDKDALVADKIAEIDVLNQKSSELVQKSSELYTQLEDNKKELTAVKLERDNLQADLEKVNTDLEQAKNTVTEKESRIEEISVQLEDSKKHAQALTDTLGELREQVQALTDKLDTCTSEKDKAISDAEDKGKTITRLNEEIEEIKSRHEQELTVLNGTVETLSNKASKAKDFKEEITTLNEQVASLNNQISDLNTELSAKNTIIETKNSELNIKETELKGYEEREKVAQERLDSKDRAYDEVIKAKNLMEQDLNSRLTQSNKVIEQLRENLKSKESEVTDLTATNSKLSNEIGSLTETLDAHKPDITASATLETELFEAKKTIAKLQNEATELKENSIDKDDLNNANARVEELENEIKNMQEDRIKERNETEQELAELRHRNADLEINLASKSKETSGIFAQMEKLTVPKVAYNLKIKDLDTLYLNHKFICVASGSTESNSSVYHLLRRTCMKNAKTKFLILDLVTETSIDRDFGIKKIEFPKDWLSGESDCKKYVAKTTLDNTCVISTGFSYLNDLALLTCNLEDKLKELDMLGAVIIVNVGCLNNLVSKILFNTLSEIMQTYVIAKATPINLRTVILSLTGLTVTKNVEVECVDYDEKASQALYHRLVQKYSAKILQSDEVLVIGE